jgi:hypothetical protein
VVVVGGAGMVNDPAGVHDAPLRLVHATGPPAGRDATATQPVGTFVTRASGEGRAVGPGMVAPTAQDRPSVEERTSVVDEAAPMDCGRAIIWTVSWTWPPDDSRATGTA